MSRRIVSVTLAMVLAQAGMPAAAGSAGEELRQRAASIPAGAYVEVQLQNRGKVVGRMADVSEEGVTLQHAQGNRIVVARIAFRDLESVKTREPRLDLETSPSAAEQALAAPPGGLVRIQLRDKRKVQGRLGELSADVLAVHVASGDSIEMRSLAFSDIKSVRAVQKSGITAKAVMLMVVVVGAIVGGIMAAGWPR